eukprot:CAMPEP_0114541076 /NCGR_PEP_ID=MMETSP0114-20121206/1110_1 /TAXON_ID=31324 /ORGANISM="Goniomonas sp, Strain m" /LENGTH=185 /DNA_ID=CAMNT_0001725285 /DNA_START=141 /DNA_END=694 /DNA_ORIENTATION=+
MPSVEMSKHEYDERDFDDPNYGTLKWNIRRNMNNCGIHSNRGMSVCVCMYLGSVLASLVLAAIGLAFLGVGSRESAEFIDEHPCPGECYLNNGEVPKYVCSVTGCCEQCTGLTDPGLERMMKGIPLTVVGFVWLALTGCASLFLCCRPGCLDSTEADRAEHDARWRAHVAARQAQPGAMTALGNG